MESIEDVKGQIVSELWAIVDKVLVFKDWLCTVSADYSTHGHVQSAPDALAAIDEYQDEIAAIKNPLEYKDPGEFPDVCPKWNAEAPAYDHETLVKSERMDDGRTRLSFAGFRGRDLTVFVNDDVEAQEVQAIYTAPILELFHLLHIAEKSIETCLETVVLLRAFQNGDSQTQPKEIVQRHIRLLKEYNDMKDVGQQIIGLIAENRGVQIKTLYEGEDYGVTAED
ncbi:Swi5 domain containing protein [Rhypophila sp. PSN 637]